MDDEAQPVTLPYRHTQVGYMTLVGLSGRVSDPARPGGARRAEAPALGLVLGAAAPSGSALPWRSSRR